MTILTGKGVFGGVAMGRAMTYKKGSAAVVRRTVADTEAELIRYREAVAHAKEELGALYERARREIGESEAAIFEIHGMMLEDEDYRLAVENVIRIEQVNAEYAVFCASERFAAVFAEMEDPYMRARVADVRDVGARLCRILEGRGLRMPTGEGVILCADDLSPSETIQLDRERILGFVTAEGSGNSHTAILARTLGIPAIVGVGEALSEVTDGMPLALDGRNGLLYVQPDVETEHALAERQQEERRARELLLAYRGLDNVTRDGTRVDIFANIQSIAEVGAARLHDAGGIGLFRSEFLYLERTDYPDEEEQLHAYRTVLQSMGDKKVIIRTLDIGADKQVPYMGLAREENPALGLRAIRICLCHPEILQTQLRALLRASAYGRLGIMFPMITSVAEVNEILSIYERVRRELLAEGEKISDGIELGVMIETPAAALISDRLAPLVDFFSIGTNDLTQYTLAMDRQNRAIERFFDEHHEAVLRLVEMTVQNAHKHGKWVGICGELGADTALTEAFLRMGVDELSVSPTAILPLRERVRSLGLSEKTKK